ncbi:MAG: hypothetical protein K0B02_02320 [DPANN group archaeon]|nr:hypothetical protein [DPANN group archaeon]
MQIRYISNHVNEITGKRVEDLDVKMIILSDLEKILFKKYGQKFIDMILKDGTLILKNGVNITDKKNIIISAKDVISFAPVIMGG